MSTATTIIEELLTPQVIGTVADVLLQLIEDVSTSAKVDAVIAEIQAFLPSVIKVAPDLVADFTNIITSLTQKDGLTDAQMSALVAAKTALDTQTDADIAAALAYAGS